MKESIQTKYNSVAKVKVALASMETIGKHTLHDCTRQAGQERLETLVDCIRYSEILSSTCNTTFYYSYLIKTGLSACGVILAPWRNPSLAGS